MEGDKLTPEQIKNWRRILSLQSGAYALIMPEKEIQTIKDKFARKVEMENNEKSLVFKCPKCGSNRLETVFDGIQCVYGGDSNTFDGKQSSIQSTRIKHFSRTAKIQR